MSGYHEKKYSEETAKAIDDEVKQILNDAYQTAKKIIQEHHDEVELMALKLMEYETLDAEDMQKILNKQWNDAEKLHKLKLISEQHKKAPVTPPPSPFEAKPNPNPISAS